MTWLRKKTSLVLTVKGAVPFHLGKLDLVRRHVLLNGLLGAFQRYFAIKQDVEPAETTLSRNPRDTRLAVELKGDDLGAARKVGLDKDIKHSPEHFWLGACECSPNGRS